MSVGKYVEDFASYTTMHGFSRIVASKASPKRIAWIIVFTTAWVSFVVQMSFVLKSYFKYPKKLTTEIVSGGVPFPDITLCNLGSFDFYAVKRLSEAVGRYNNDSDLHLNDSFIRGMLKFYVLLDNNDTLDDGNWDFFAAKMFSRTTLAANVPIEMLSANGYQEDEFIVKCLYRDQKCRFKKIFDPYFFNCYTFTASNVTSSEEDDPVSLSDGIEGIENGFSVMLMAGTGMLKEVEDTDLDGMPGIYSNDSALSGAAGVRVVIHPPGTKPFPLTEGYDIPPGRMASLSLSPKTRKRLGLPYGNCSKKFPGLTDDEQKLAGPFRKTACDKVCIQNHIYKECGCYENTLPTKFDLLSGYDDDVTSLNNSKRLNITRENDLMKLHDECITEKYLEGDRNDGGEDLCKTFEKCSGTIEFHKCFKFYSPDMTICDDEVLLDTIRKMKCAAKAKFRAMSNADLLSQCGCYPACNEDLYDVAYSLSQWPSDGIDGESVVSEFKDLKYIDKFSSQEKRDFYDAYLISDFKSALSDFSKINVYVSDANVVLTVEEPAMDRTGLVCNIGGQLGVWIGVSVLTIAEVLEILILMVMDCCRKRSKEYKPKEAENDHVGLPEEQKTEKVETHI